MAKLLTLSLTETTRKRTGYQVIARNLDNQEWVMLRVPRDDFRTDQEVRWDLFAVTEAAVKEKPDRKRPEEHILDYTSTPRLIRRYSTPNQKLKILTKLKAQNVNSIYHSPHYVGIVKPDEILDIAMSPKEQQRDKSDFDLNRRFFWDARVKFQSNGEWDMPCKDMRWKQYWLDVKQQRSSQFEDLKTKWISHMMQHNTFFLIEIYPPWRGRNYPAISGIHCFCV